MLQRPIMIILTMLQLHISALASATSEDFNICKKEALKDLEVCFISHPANDSSVYQCWPKNEQNYRDCIRRVIQQYHPSQDDILKRQKKQALEKKLKAEQEAKQQKEANN